MTLTKSTQLRANDILFDRPVLWGTRSRSVVFKNAPARYEKAKPLYIKDDEVAKEELKLSPKEKSTLKKIRQNKIDSDDDQGN